MRKEKLGCREKSEKWEQIEEEHVSRAVMDRRGKRVALLIG